MHDPSSMRQSAFAMNLQAGRYFALGHQAHPLPAGTPDFLLYALALMILTYVWRIQDLFSMLGALKLNLIAASLSIGFFAVDHHFTRRIGLLQKPILFCVLVTVGIAILGIPTSLWPGRSATTVARELVPNLVLMILIAASVRSVRDLWWLALVNLVGGCAYSLFSLIFAAGSDGFDQLFYYDRNDLALVLVCTIPFAIFFLVKRGWGYRLLAVSSVVLLLTAIVKTGSRGGFLGFVAVAAYVLTSYRAIPRRHRVLTVAAGLGLLSLIAGDNYWAKIRTLQNPQRDYNWAGRSPEGRMEVWKRGLGYMVANPVLGVGMGNFATAEGHLSELSKRRSERGAGFKWSVAHNSFLEIGVELGMIGLAAFVGILAAALRGLRSIRSAAPLNDSSTMRDVAFACTLSASIVGFIVSGFFVSAWYFSYLYMILGLTIGFIKLRHLSQPCLTHWLSWYSRGHARTRRLPRMWGPDWAHNRREFPRQDHRRRR